MPSLDTYFQRYREEEHRKWLEKLRADLAEWKRTHRRAYAEVTVRNTASGEVEQYTVKTLTEEQDLLNEIAARGPFQPYPIKEVMPGLYQVGPFEVRVRWYWEERRDE